MQGRGVTNFSNDRPTHGYTTRTTEFDDELIRRGIVTTEQAMMAKGASAEEAIRLAREKKNEGEPAADGGAVRASGDGTASDDFDDDHDSDSDFGLDDDFDDDAFVQRYRQERLEQLKKEQQTRKDSELALAMELQSRATPVLHISREQWREQVNEASVKDWVIVTMVEASGDRRDRVVQELHKLAREFCGSGNGDCKDDSSSDDDDDESDDESDSESDDENRLRRRRPPRLRTIDAADAIPNWPEERVPAMFAYRDGVKRHEWIASRRGEFPSRDLLEELFRRWSVIR